MPPPTRLDDEMVAHKISSHHEEELDRLKKRNNRLEEDLRLMNDQLLNKAGVQPMGLAGNGGNTFAVGGNRLGADAEELRKEKNQLIEENNNLQRMLKESGQYDMYMLKKENERLNNIIREFESNYGNVSPQSGDVRILSQKIAIYERSIRELEENKSGLLVRATMAEEQLRGTQDNLMKITQEYERKLYELKKTIGGKG